MNRTYWVLLVFLAVAGFFLVTEHRAHLFGILPFVLVLVCVLAYLFHETGHRGSHRDEAGSESGGRVGAGAASPKQDRRV